MTRWINTGMNHGNETYVVHTDPGCQYVNAETKTEAEVNVDLDDLEKCEQCSGDFEPAEQPRRPCPFCGEEVHKLPTHLPCEASP